MGATSRPSLADPKRVQPEPKIGRNDPEAALAHAYVLGFRQDLKAAAAAARRRKNASRTMRASPCFRPRCRCALNEREEMRDAVARAQGHRRARSRCARSSTATFAAISTARSTRALAELAPGRGNRARQSDIWNRSACSNPSATRRIAAEAAPCAAPSRKTPKARSPTPISPSCCSTRAASRKRAR